MLAKIDFAHVFEVGEIIQSGANPHRKNAAHLKILSIEENMIRYHSIHSGSGNLIRYEYLSLIIENFERLNPRSIQRSVNTLLKEAKFKPDYTTENYAYTLAKAFYERTHTKLFLSEGEVQATDPLGSKDFKEGRRVAVLVERIERDDAARAECIKHHGSTCKACSFNFEHVFGELGKGYIHVHHRTIQLSETRGEHPIDPIRDLIPLCPNCHAMVHARSPMLTVQALQAILNTNARATS